ncbi:MAG: hypothetical protein ISQ34_05780 [Rickettsiales bacterium]|nr:hypothetical protein [Rickettsiales bacterium]
MLNLGKERKIYQNPLISQVCAIFCEILKNKIIADLDCVEDSSCGVDANCALNENFNLIEIQGTAESKSMSFEQLSKMCEFAKKLAEEIFKIQKKVLLK